MKQLLYIPVILLLILGCASDRDAGPQISDAAPVEGKWLLIETEQIVNGKKVWIPANTLTPTYIYFRYDGVILNEDRKSACCAPKFLSINNNLIEIKPQETIAYVSDCTLVLCGSCPVWDIEMTGNEMIIAQCQVPRNKYVKN